MTMCLEANLRWKAVRKRRGGLASPYGFVAWLLFFVSTLILSPSVAHAVLAVQPATLPTGSGSVPYNEVLTATGGTGSYTFSIVAGALPAGLSLSSAGVLSGTPTAAGSFNFTVQATDSLSDTGATAYMLIISTPIITVSPASLPSAVAGTAYSQTFTASGGAGPYSFSLVSGGLPIGMSMSSAGVFSGTPTVTGTYNFIVRATDLNGFTSDHAYSVTVTAPTITVSPASLPAGVAGTAYSETFTASGGAAPYSFSLVSGGLPIGMSMSSAGVFSGTPTVTGTYNFIVRATDLNGFTSDRAYSLTITAPTITVSPVSLPAGMAGTAYSQTFTGSGGAAPYSFSLVSGGLPIGMSMSSAGVFSGTPIVAGTYNFTVRATDLNGFTSDRAYSVTITAPTITIAPASLPTGVAGTAYSQTFTASGGTSPYTFSLVSGGLPVGMAMSSAGVFSGTPSVAGNYNFTVRATDSDGFTGDIAYSVTITAPTITVSPASLPAGVAGTAYSQTFTGSGGTSPYTFSLVSGGLPVGMAMSSAGVFSGTPSVAGTYNFTVRVTDADGFTGDHAYSVAITAPTIAVAPGSLPSATLGIAYSQALTASGGTAPYTFAVASGALPPGIAFASSGSFSGTPTAAGAYAFTISATDADGFSTTVGFNIAISARPDPTSDAEVIGILQAQADATRRFARTQIDNFQQRLEALHGSGEAVEDGIAFSNGLVLNFADECADSARRLSAQSCARGATPDINGFGLPRVTSAATAATTIWTAGAITVGDDSGIDFETSGLSAGIDRRWSDSLTIGAGLGYGHDESDVGESGSRSDSDAFTAALYGSYHPGDVFFLDSVVGYQWLSFDTQRFVTGTGDHVDGTRDGQQWFASVTAGGEFKVEDWMISPYTRLDLARAKLDAYSENGDPAVALHYHEQDVDTSTLSLGLRVGYSIASEVGTISPELRLEFQHDFQGNGSAFLNYADGLGPVYRADLSGLERDRFLLGLGATVETANDVAVRVQYRGLFGGDTDDHSFLLGLQARF